MNYIEIIRQKYNVLHASQETIDKTALLVLDVTSNLLLDPNAGFEAAELVLGRRIDSKEQDVLALWFLQAPETALVNLQKRRQQEAQDAAREEVQQQISEWNERYRARKQEATKQEFAIGQKVRIIRPETWQGRICTITKQAEDDPNMYWLEEHGWRHTDEIELAEVSSHAE